MSKSKGNVINPDKYIQEYGADTLRIYLMFIGPFDQGGDFREQATIGVHRFLQKVWNLSEKIQVEVEAGEEANTWRNKTIDKVESDTKKLRFNTAISAMMEWVNFLSRQEKVSKKDYIALLLILAPYAPHVTEELWQNLGEKDSIHLNRWPAKDKSVVKKSTVNIPVQVNGKLRGIIKTSSGDLTKDTIVKLALQIEAVQKFTSDSAYEAVYVEGRILNFVLINKKTPLLLVK